MLDVANWQKAIYHLFKMARAINIITALLCLICVIAICIAPSVDLPQTTLKSLQFVILLMLSLIASTYLLSSILYRTIPGLLIPDGYSTAPPSSLLRPIETNCVLQY
jgi:hypothetical protein